MYAIINVIYGIPLTQKINDLINKWEEDITDEKWNENDGKLCGFEILYSGSGSHMSGFCGISLDQFKEPNGYNDLTKLKIKPTNDQIMEGLKLIEVLDPSIRSIMPPVGVYLIWSTS